MQKQQIWSQLNNQLAVYLYSVQCNAIAENVFTIKNLPKFIDEGYVNKKLVREGSIAFFYEEELGTMLALPYVNLSGLDVYGRPRKSNSSYGLKRLYS